MQRQQEYQTAKVESTLGMFTGDFVALLYYTEYIFYQR